MSTDFETERSKAFVNTMTMISKRGYQDVEQIEDCSTYKEYRCSENELEDIPDLSVLFFEKEVDSNVIQPFVERLSSLRNIFVIVAPSIKKKTRSLLDMENVRIFLYEDLIIDITEHRYTPKHVRMSLEEQEKIRERYSTWE